MSHLRLEVSSYRCLRTLTPIHAIARAYSISGLDSDDTLRPGLTEERTSMNLLWQFWIRCWSQQVSKPSPAFLWDFSPLSSDCAKCREGRDVQQSTPDRVASIRLMSRLFGLNTRYHRVLMRHKFGPAAAYYVLTSVDLNIPSPPSWLANRRLPCQESLSSPRETDS